MRSPHAVIRFVVPTLFLALCLPAVTAWGSAYSSAVLSKNPVAYWRFEDGSAADGATAADATGNFDGAYVSRDDHAQGDVQLINDTAYKLGGRAASFSGVGRSGEAEGPVVAVPGSTGTPSLGNFGSQHLGSAATLEFWLRSPGVSNDRMLGTFSDSGSGTTPVMTAYTNGNTQLFLRQEGSGQLDARFGNSDVNLYDGEWHHVVWQFNDVANNGLSSNFDINDVPIGDDPYLLWIDGERIDLTYSNHFGGTNPATFADFDNPFRIGGAGRGGLVGNSFAGQFDEFAIYDRLLTEAEIGEHFLLATVPEPSTYALLGLGLLGLLIWRRRR